ncbi:MAG TPA: sigma factor [Candidatus Dormibacteraeota bacterium]|nr:sigma factor [Candidatus Dormibacteraeota bacterium]
MANAAALPLGVDEHRRLLEAAGSGDGKARERLTRAHLDWVASAAEERAGRGLSQGDLFQEGTIGLLEAIGAFHASGASDFERFAREQVALRMDQALSEERRQVRDAEMLLQAADEYEQAEISLRRELGRQGSDVEMAARLEWSLQRTVAIRELVTEARRRYDEDLVQYLEEEDVEIVPRDDGQPRPGGGRASEDG